MKPGPKRTEDLTSSTTSPSLPPRPHPVKVSTRGAWVASVSHPPLHHYPSIHPPPTPSPITIHPFLPCIQWFGAFSVPGTRSHQRSPACGPFCQPDEVGGKRNLLRGSSLPPLTPGLSPCPSSSASSELVLREQPLHLRETRKHRKGQPRGSQLWLMLESAEAVKLLEPRPPLETLTSQPRVGPRVLPCSSETLWH